MDSTLKVVVEEHEAWIVRLSHEALTKQRELAEPHKELTHHDKSCPIPTKTHNNNND